MKTLILLTCIIAFSTAAQADGFNERNHADPGAQAKINRVIAQAYATNQPPVDHAAVFQNVQPPFGQGLNLGINNGVIAPSKMGLGPREVNVVTGPNTVICLHCR